MRIRKGSQKSITFRGKRFSPRQVADLMDHAPRLAPYGDIVLMLNGVAVSAAYERILDDGLVIRSTRERADGIHLTWVETRGWHTRPREAFLRLR